MNILYGSETFRRLNPHIFGLGGLPSAVAKPERQGQPAPAHGLEAQGARRVVVSLVCFRRRLCDDDNLVAGCKHLRDAIAASLGLDDGDAKLRWEYSQTRTDGPQGVAVRISFQ